jgi:hypothetical protein
VVVPTTAGVDAVTDAAFREYGLPRALRSDNGPPFASTGVGGLSRLAVKWLKLGIHLERIDPGAPQQNGSSRAHARHAEGGDGAATGGHSGRTAAALR